MNGICCLNIQKRGDFTEHILSLSYGKDSLACLGAIEKLGLPLDRIIHAEVWATETIPADLPPMMEFKKKADKIIKERWGIEVEHICATRKINSQTVNVEREREQLRCVKTYEDCFYSPHNYATPKLPFKERNGIYGFPCSFGSWCNSRLKVGVLDGFARGRFDLRKVFLSENGELQETPTEHRENIRISDSERKLVYERTQTQKQLFLKCPTAQGARKNIVQYLGIACDEPKRIERHIKKKGIVLPLVEAKWDEAYCRKWCEENDLLSPIYTSSARGGCWFCHNQDIDSLRRLRHNYPDLWELLLKWDLDSPTSFHSDGHTVHDFDKRFELEDKGIVPIKKFRWSMLKDNEEQITFFESEE